MILYEHDEKEYKTLGICDLSDNLGITVTEGLNGEFELELEYSIDNPNFKELKHRRQIFCKHDPYDPPQPFRIYSISTPINRTVTVNAAHVSYDTTGYPVEPFTSKSAAELASRLNDRAIIPSPFTFSTDIIADGEVVINNPVSSRSILGGPLLDTFKAEIKYDKYDIRFLKRRGVDTKVVITYGDNLVDLKQEENIDGVYTEVYPFWRNHGNNDELVTVTLPEKTVPTKGDWQFKKVLVYDASSENEQPTVEQLREKTKKYIEEENLGVPKISLDVSFVQLSDEAGYTGSKLLDKVQLGDVVTVRFKDANVDATAKCVKTIYDPNIDRYKSIELGEPKSSISDTIADGADNVDDKIDGAINFMEDAIKNATDQITGAKGGNVVIRPKDKPREILIMDTEDIETATNVWRWNMGGLGHSKTGYEGPYGVAITQDGKIVANYIATGELNANLIKVGVLRSFGDACVIDMESGEFKLGGSGDAVCEHTRRYSKWIHSTDGTTEISATGLKRNGRPYHSLIETGHAIVGGSAGNYPAVATIQLPPEFKGKRFRVIVQMVDTQGGIVNELMKRVYLNITAVNTEDAWFKVRGYWTADYNGHENEKELQFSFIAIGG